MQVIELDVAACASAESDVGEQHKVSDVDELIETERSGSQAGFTATPTELRRGVDHELPPRHSRLRLFGGSACRGRFLAAVHQRASCTWMLVLGLVVCVGCGRPTADLGSEGSSGASRALTGEVSPPAPARLTNRFGMTFCLVTIDAGRPDHKDAYPNRSYYLQQTELSGGQFRKFGEQTVERWEERIEMPFPTQWQDVAELAKRLSAADPDYDYRLPTQAEWSFACKNGYDQTCPKFLAGSTPDSIKARRPNKYGIEGFVNYDIECGNVPGQFLGQLNRYDWMYSLEEVPACRCDHVTYGNPRSDDGLDELITGRFVLTPKTPLRNRGGP